MIGLNFEAWSLGLGNLVTAKTKQRDDDKADTAQQHGRGNYNSRLAFSILSNEEEANLSVEYKLSNCFNLKFPERQNAPKFCHHMQDKVPLLVSRKHHGPTNQSWWIVGNMGSNSSRQHGCHGCYGPIWGQDDFQNGDS
jgi:hypothetical protein